MSGIQKSYGPTAPATEKIQKICDQLKPQVEERTRETYEIFTAHKYRSQGVFHYLFKVYVGGNKYLHLKVSKDWLGRLLLQGVQKDKEEEDPILPF